MRFNTEKAKTAKAMTPETKELGKQFVQALLQEGHDYASIQLNFLALLGIGAVGAASKKLAANSGAAVSKTSGYTRGSVNEAAKMLGVSRNYVGKMVYGAGLMTPTPRRSLENLVESR